MIVKGHPVDACVLAQFADGNFLNIIMEIFPEEQEDSSLMPNAAQQNSSLKIYAFTDRELEVVQLLQKGFSNQQIADTLYMSIPTVKTHTGNIYKKLGMTSRTAAISKLASKFHGHR